MSAVLQYFYEVANTDPVPVGFFPLSYYFLYNHESITLANYFVWQSQKHLWFRCLSLSLLFVSISGLGWLLSYKILFSLIILQLVHSVHLW